MPTAHTPLLLSLLSLGACSRSTPPPDALAPLGSLGSSSQPTSIPSLRSDSRAPDQSVATSAVTTHVTNLQSKDLQVRIAAAMALFELGGAAAPALPALRIAAEDQDPRLRYLAIQAIQRIEARR